MARSTTARILVVDDDELVVTSLRSFFELESDYRLVTHTDPRRAVEELERAPVDVVISDFMMPELNGLEFLRQARRLQPEAARIMLTGFADKENAIRAINEVGLYQYLEKPWDNDQLLVLIRNALQDQSLRRQLSDKVKALEELARDHSSLASRHESLSREVEMAARVQRQILPAAMPKVEGFEFHCLYRPSTMIGGDYYDWTRRDGRVVFLVADASGHGVQAALTSMVLKSAFHEGMVRAEGPADLLTAMNGQLYPVLPNGMFAAALLVWIDVPSGKIQVVNSGLPFPFLLGRRGELKEMTLGGIPLGLFSQTVGGAYESRELELEPGDGLLVASDGLGEIRGPHGEYQDRRLRECLGSLNGRSSEALVEQLMADAAAYSEDDGLRDDVSIFMARRTE